MPDNGNQRTRLVAALWALKQGFVRHKVPGLTYIHLHMLLTEAEYRADIIRKAQESTHPELRQLGQEAAALNLPGRLLLNESQSAVASSMPGSPHMSRMRLAMGGVVFLVVLGMLGSAGGFLLTQTSLAPHGKVVKVRGPITRDTTWEAENSYYLETLVYVQNNARLHIEAGTRIFDMPDSALIVTRGAQLLARGTANAPIVFSSARPSGKRGRGDWGGVVLLGAAPINVGEARIEGVPATETRAAYGGNNPQHVCGVLEYVRIEFAGFAAFADNELNGLTLGGCGSDTLVQHVQVHMGKDDGVELFGGSVNLKYILITRAADDALDWDLGWNGKLQFLAVQQDAEGDNAIEADNLGSNHNALPRSAPTLYNISLIGAPGTRSKQRAITLREGSGGHFHNFLITGYGLEAVDVRDPVTAALVHSNELQFTHGLLYNIGAGGQSYFLPETDTTDDDGGFSEPSYFRNAAGVALGANPELSIAAFSTVQPDFVPTAAGAAAQIGRPPPEGDFWDEGTQYAGAFAPDTEKSWIAGWTAFPSR